MSGDAGYFSRPDGAAPYAVTSRACSILTRNVHAIAARHSAYRRQRHFARHQHRLLVKIITLLAAYFHLCLPPFMPFPIFTYGHRCFRHQHAILPSILFEGVIGQTFVYCRCTIFDCRTRCCSRISAFSLPARYAFPIRAHLLFYYCIRLL